VRRGEPLPDRLEVLARIQPLGDAPDPMMAMIREDLAALGIRHDVFFSERTLQHDGAVANR
jgi:arginyl-tRNA synthetase